MQKRQVLRRTVWAFVVWVFLGTLLLLWQAEKRCESRLQAAVSDVNQVTALDNCIDTPHTCSDLK